GNDDSDGHGKYIGGWTGGLNSRPDAGGAALWRGPALEGRLQWLPCPFPGAPAHAAQLAKAPPAGSYPRSPPCAASSATQPQVRHAHQQLEEGDPAVVLPHLARDLVDDLRASPASYRDRIYLVVYVSALERHGDDRSLEPHRPGRKQ